MPGRIASSSNCDCLLRPLAQPGPLKRGFEQDRASLRLYPPRGPGCRPALAACLCEKLGLTGRIIISKDGINATVGGELNAVKQYVKTTREYKGFHGIDVKWSDGGAADFPRLSVKVRDEIVSFGAPGELKVDAGG